jgi:hypothetical protein
MTFDPFRDMGDAVPSEPPPGVKGQRAAPWMGVVFAVAMVMLIVAGWYFWGSTMSPSMRAENSSPAERSQTK